MRREPQTCPLEVSGRNGVARSDLDSITSRTPGIEMDGNPSAHDHTDRILVAGRPHQAAATGTLPLRRLPALQPMVLALLLLASLYTLYFAQGIVLPIVGAIILKLLLAPLLRFLVRWHVPHHAAAALIMFTFVGGLAYGLYSLWDPANEWRLRMPQLLYEMEIDGPFVDRNFVSRIGPGFTTTDGLAGRDR